MNDTNTGYRPMLSGIGIDQYQAQYRHDAVNAFHSLICSAVARGNVTEISCHIFVVVNF